MLKEFLNEALVEKISMQHIRDNNLFGPVYHGTLSDKQEKIDKEGFKVFVGNTGQDDISHGYGVSNYFEGIPPPVHHLGYGIYLTTVKSIAKDFSYGGHPKNEYYLDIDRSRFLEINFGAPKTMMKWWIDNGYDPELAKKDRVSATIKLTDNLKSKYDAVWFKGKGLRRLLDGDQICVYDLDIIKQLDLSLSQKGEIGSKVSANQDIEKYGKIIPKGTKGTILNIRKISEEHRHFHNGEDTFYDIKFAKGGMQYNIYGSQIDLL